MTSSQDRAQEQVAAAARQGQEALIASLRTWSEQAQRWADTRTSAGSTPDALQVVDQFFGFAAELLEAQHQMVRSFVGSVAPAAEQVWSAARGAAATVADVTDAAARRASDPGVVVEGETVDSTRKSSNGTQTASARRSKA